MMMGIGTPSSQSNIPRPISASFVHYGGGSHTDEPSSRRLILVIKPTNARATLFKWPAGNKSRRFQRFLLIASATALADFLTASLASPTALWSSPLFLGRLPQLLAGRNLQRTQFPASPFR